MFTRADSQAAIAKRAENAIPFRLAFPLGQLVLCAILLWPVRPLIAYELGLPMLAGPPVIFRFIDLPMLRPFARWSQRNGMLTAAVINLPAVVFELPFMLLKKDSAQHRARRALGWPILAMPFWWIAGRGAEALAAARKKKLTPRVKWVETVIGFLFLAGGITIVIGVEVFSGADRHDLQFLAAVGALWAFLGGLSVGAKIAQWRLGKSLAAGH